ncbi:MAG: CPBP family intramembrane glutamic endopeptidase [Gemmatimonadaceae bacterium]
MARAGQGGAERRAARTRVLSARPPRLWLHVVTWFLALQLFQVAYVPVLFLPPWGGAIWGGALLLAIAIGIFRRLLLQQPAEAARLRLDRLPPRGWRLPALAAALIAFTWVFTALLFRFNDPMDDSDIGKMFEKPGGIVPALFIVGLVAPLMEELMTRGYLQEPIERRVGTLAAIAISGGVFAIAHLTPERNFPLFCTGAVAAYAVITTRSLWSGIAIHMANNLTALLLSALPAGGGDDRAFEAWLRSPESVVPLASLTWVLGVPVAWLMVQLRDAEPGRSIVIPPPP